MGNCCYGEYYNRTYANLDKDKKFTQETDIHSLIKVVRLQCAKSHNDTKIIDTTTLFHTKKTHWIFIGNTKIFLQPSINQGSHKINWVDSDLLLIEQRKYNLHLKSQTWINSNRGLFILFTYHRNYPPTIHAVFKSEQECDEKTNN
jgi:hypothetical protein